MTFIDHITNIIQIGGCVVMGVGVAPEKYRLLLQGATNQDYLIIGPKDSADVKFIASRIGGEYLEIRSATFSGTEMDIYLIRGDNHGTQPLDEADPVTPVKVK